MAGAAETESRVADLEPRYRALWTWLARETLARYDGAHADVELQRGLELSDDAGPSPDAPPRA